MEKTIKLVATQNIEDAIRRENAEIPGGRVEGNEREFAVRRRVARLHT